MSGKKDRQHLSADVLYEALLKRFEPHQTFLTHQAAEQWECNGDLARARLYSLVNKGMAKKIGDGRYSLYDDEDKEFFGKEYPKDPEHEGWMHFVTQQRMEKQRMSQWQKYS